eukprot:CAMPEP_0194324524 /NCGR_PEP_ID=MMETSP0171-20130528/28316_1 /TAXON_ID=218684 /ORGANISM="Corethron pennatum, Strain L29A3" /LENGTH=183 /DNA_ID=CAMNT_0039083445 /DNA_START=86 /DNA_END=637 /DNA_ORIENTATION=+
MSCPPSLLLPAQTARAWFPRMEEAGDGSIDQLEREEEEYARFLRNISNERPANDPIGTHMPVGVGQVGIHQTTYTPGRTGGGVRSASRSRNSAASFSSGLSSVRRGDPGRFVHGFEDDDMNMGDDDHTETRRRIRNGSDESLGGYFDSRSRSHQLYVSSHTINDSMSFGQSFEEDGANDSNAD